MNICVYKKITLIATLTLLASLFMYSYASAEEHDSVGYLIITSDSLKNSGVFQPLINNKIAKGLSVMLESVEAIEATYSGRDPQEKIRNYIKDLHINNGVIWVLLGGDTDIVPARFIGGTVCDMYYSDVDGDWDADGDNNFGEFEDNVDLYPDIFIGRAPVENKTEAQVFVNKVLAYEGNLSDYTKTALFLGNADLNDAGGTANDFIASEYMPEGFLLTKYYERDITAYRDLTIQAINEGYSFINHLDHGDIGYLGTGADRISISNIDALTNASALPILYSTGCAVAAIDYDCIAEHWITNPHGGGVAFIGTSGGGDYPEADQMLNPEFYKSLFIEGFTHIGQTLADSKITFINKANSNPAMRRALFNLNLLGDPEMDIHTTGKNFEISITAPPAQSFVRGEINIVGSAFTEDIFKEYKLYIAPKTNPENTTLISSLPFSVQNNYLTDKPLGTSHYSDGQYLLILEVVDINDRKFRHCTNVVIDNINQPPEFVNLINRGAVIGRTLEFKVEVQDPDDPETPAGQILECSASISQDLLNRGARFEPDTRTFVWQPLNSDKGSYEVTFLIRDNEHTVSKTITLLTLCTDEFPVTADSSAQYSPDIYGNKIVWTDERNGSPENPDIYMYDISTGQETQITTAPYRQGCSSIYKDKIVWEDWRNGNLDIYMYDLLTNTEAQITSNTDQQFDTAIYQNKIVWLDCRSQKGSIYMTKFAFAPQITSVSPTQVSAGGILTITGTNFGYAKEDSQIQFANGVVCLMQNWTNTRITCVVPNNAKTGPLKVITQGGESNAIMVTVTNLNTPPQMLFLVNIRNQYLYWSGYDKEDGYRIRYSYRVDTREWSKPSYANWILIEYLRRKLALKPGQHIFEVKAIDAKGWASKVKLKTFYIKL